MNYRYLGGSGLKVSEICFGTMTFGGAGGFKDVGEIGQDEANRQVAMCLEAGCNFFDTADVYSAGLSEEILGQALRTRRGQAIVATKVRWRVGDGVNDVGLSRSRVIEACEQSLKRLRTDYIDLYQLHGFDPRTPLEETMRALDDLVRAGKVRYIGCSNFSAWHTMKAQALAAQMNLTKFCCLQMYYSLACRDIEAEFVPMALDQNLGILCWSPLGGGYFSGKYRGAAAAQTGRWAKPDAPVNKYWPVDLQRAGRVLDALEGMARRHEVSMAQAALNYLLRKPAVSSVIIGARTSEQLADNLKAGDWSLTADEVAQLDELSKPPRLYPYWHQEYGSGDR